MLELFYMTIRHYKYGEEMGSAFDECTIKSINNYGEPNIDDQQT
jgi:hypothetical protein